MPASLDGSVDGQVAVVVDGGGKVFVSPPAFAGVTAVAPVSDSALLVVWTPAVQPGDPAASLAYHVYSALGTSALGYQTPAAYTGPGAASAVIGGLQPGVAYVVGARAVNGLGVEDQNTTQLRGTPANDTVAPTFGGAKAAAAGGSGAVTLSWDAARDDLSPAGAISYLVYASGSAGGEDFATPTLVTSPGATSATVSRLSGGGGARFFVVLARDAAGNVSGPPSKEVSSEPGADVVPPLFGGCTAATSVQSVTIATTWTPATDDVSSPNGITYDIYASNKSGKYDFSQPFAKVKGNDIALISALTPATRYYFVCRARDEAGNEEHNVAEVTALTGSDPTPPTFAGITPGAPGYAADPVGFAATLAWSAGMDNATPPERLVYDVYTASTPGGENFVAPPFASSAAGESTITLTNLPSNTTLYFVVRARDADGNHDSNTVERPAMAEPVFKTNVRFSGDIQPIFTHDCGVVGCHVPGSPTGNLILVPGQAYAQLVNVANGGGFVYPSDGGVPPIYVVPGSPLFSYLDAKIDPTNTTFGRVQGNYMPAPSTGSTLSAAQKSAVYDWINQGALNN